MGFGVCRGRGAGCIGAWGTIVDPIDVGIDRHTNILPVCVVT